MQRLFFLSAALVALTSAGPVVADPAAIGGVYNWTGFYVGGNGGYAWGQQKSTLNIADGPTGLTCHFCDGFNPLGGNDVTLAQNAGSPTLNPKTFTGGAQIGYNWQTSRWVYGLEVDFGTFRQRETTNTSFGLPGSTALIPFGGVCGATGASECVGHFSTTVETDWLATLRPRIGYVWYQTLVYATGGLAVTKLKFSQSYADNLGYPLVPGSTGAGGSVSASASATRAGFIFGGGFEQALGNNWSLKAEYLHTRFDGVTANGRLSDGLTGAFGSFANFANDTGRLSSNVVRAGLNYKFGGAVVPNH